MAMSLFLTQFIYTLVLIVISVIFLKIPNRTAKNYTMSMGISAIVGLLISFFHYGFFLFDATIQTNTFFQYFVNDHPLIGFFYFLMLSIIIEVVRSVNIIKCKIHKGFPLNLMQQSLGWTLAEGFWFTSLIIWNAKYTLANSYFLFNAIIILIFFTWNYLLGYISVRSAESSKYVMFAAFLRAIFFLSLIGLLGRDYSTIVILLNLGSITLFQIFLNLILMYGKPRSNEFTIE